jgi:acetolactate decarboxylase
MSIDLQTRVSASIWKALEERSRTSGQSVAHIVQMALAEALDVEHHSIFQVSTSGAIVQGLYQGCVTVADLRRHGDLGLGTFEDLDGEMILIDGHCFQARSDGTVVEAPDDALTPFASVVNFAPDSTAELTDVRSYRELTERLDGLRTSKNGMVSLKATGRFDSIRVRAACRTESGVDLVEATSQQAVFDYTDVPGTLVGFWSPDYAKSIAISGWHLHFISDDRTNGGHVLDLDTRALHVELNDVNDVHLAIPETAAFLEADLREDNEEALRVAEHGGRRTNPSN